MKKVIKIGIVLIVIAALAALIVPRILYRGEVTDVAVTPTVEVIKPESGSIEISSGFIGKVEPSDVVYVYPTLGGEVTEVYVKAGETVAEGQSICKIDTKQVDTARIALDSAKIAYDTSNTNLSRMQVLFASGDISAQAFESAKSGAESAKLQLESAQLQYDNQIKYSEIKATIGGLVEACDIQVHDNVSQQNLICVISGQGGKQITFSVPERIVSALSAGDSIRVEKGGSEHSGSITEVSSMVDTTGLFKIKASVENGDTLATGSSVKLYVTSDKVSNTITIPVDAIYYSGGDAYVYTYDEGTVHYVPVEVGLYDSEKAQILSGIDMDTQIITTWSSELYEGSKVQLAQ